MALLSARLDTNGYDDMVQCKNNRNVLASECAKPRLGRNPHVGKGELALPVTRTGRDSGGINGGDGTCCVDAL